VEKKLHQERGSSFSSGKKIHVGSESRDRKKKKPEGNQKKDPCHCEIIIAGDEEESEKQGGKEDRTSKRAAFKIAALRMERKGRLAIKKRGRIGQEEGNPFLSKRTSAVDESPHLGWGVGRWRKKGSEDSVKWESVSRRSQNKRAGVASWKRREVYLGKAFGRGTSNGVVGEAYEGIFPFL